MNMEIKKAYEFQCNDLKKNGSLVVIGGVVKYAKKRPGCEDGISGRLMGGAP
ncbi:MAG: hypothetical protein KJ970_04195 [Candidatus Eisenbacteria bacterium]|uniref:Uncharacterized protein n=1 Tax=Eiseniibacteriota bacterium TaxID=2212470 RepID=A0A948RSK6_UNCEI|nr:hypothetical protein [Candidatus Eisenbacteria bacterium]